MISKIYLFLWSHPCRPQRFHVPLDRSHSTEGLGTFITGTVTSKTIIVVASDNNFLVIVSNKCDSLGTFFVVADI